MASAKPILSFPLPEADRPAQPRLDDAEYVRDCRVFTDEPQMHALITSLNNKNRVGMDNRCAGTRDHRIFTDEPLMHTLITFLDNTKGVGLDNITERVR